MKTSKCSNCGKKIYVKKLVNWTPRRYDVISLEEAIKNYEEYICYCIKSQFVTKNSDITFKTFDLWRTTEI